MRITDRYGRRMDSPYRNISSEIIERRARIIAKVIKLDESSSKLNINMLCEVRDFETGWQFIPGDTRESRIIYDQFFKGIIARAKRKSK